MTDSSLPPARFARISSYLHNDNDKAIEVSRNDSVVNDVEPHPARTTSLAPKAYIPKGFHELSDTGKCELQELEKLGELDGHDSPAEVPSTPVNQTSRSPDKLEGMETVSPMTTRQSYELDATNQTDEPKMSEKRMSYQRRASIPFRSSLRSNIFASRKPSSKYSKEAPSSISSDAAKDRSSADSSAPRHSSNIEFLKDGTNHNKEVVITTTRSEGSFEDVTRGHYSPTVSDMSKPNDRNSTLSALPHFYQDRGSFRFSEASVGIAEIAELSDRNSRHDSEPNCLQSPISERFSDSPPSWMKRLSNDKSQRSSMGADEKLNEASAVGPLGGDGGHGSWHRDGEMSPSSPGSNERSSSKRCRQVLISANTFVTDTALLLSAASSAQRQRSRSRPRRKPVEVEEEVVPEYDDTEARQAEQDAFDIVEAASPTRTDFRV